jgi:hypothetical protein
VSAAGLLGGAEGAREQAFGVEAEERGLQPQTAELDEVARSAFSSWLLALRRWKTSPKPRREARERRTPR